MNKNFESLVKKLSPTLRKIARKLNGHFSFFDDDDLYQEALARLWILFLQGRLDDKTDSYVLQGSYFHLKNYLRKTLDKARLESLDQIIGEDDSTLEDILDSKNRSPDSIDDKLMMGEVVKNGLTEREIEILSLSFDGMTVREIGKRLGISHVMVIKIKKKMRLKCRSLRTRLKTGYQN